MKKKAAALMAILSAFTVMSCPVMALEPQAVPDEGAIVQPRWTYIYLISAGLDKYGNIDSGVELYGSEKYLVTVELRKADGKFVASWQKENGDVVTSYDLESGVRYYTKVTVKVFNSSGNIIETATMKSSIVTAQ